MEWLSILQFLYNWKHLLSCRINVDEANTIVSNHKGNDQIQVNNGTAMLKGPTRYFNRIVILYWKHLPDPECIALNYVDLLKLTIKYSYFRKSW